MIGYLCQSSTCIQIYGESKFIDLTSWKGNTNGPQQGNGRNRRVTDREPSFRARVLDRKDETQHEEQLSSNGPSAIRSSSAATGTHAGTPPMPAKKSGTGVGPCPCAPADNAEKLLQPTTVGTAGEKLPCRALEELQRRERSSFQLLYATALTNSTNGGKPAHGEIAITVDFSIPTVVWFEGKAMHQERLNNCDD